MMRRIRRPYQSVHFALVLIAIPAMIACDPPAPPAGDSSAFQIDELSDGEFILYNHPDDPRILGGLTEDGEGLTVYAEKDGRGLPTNLTALRYQEPYELGTDDATWIFFDDSGQLGKMLGVDGSTIEFDWISATRVAVSAVSADGSTQVNTTMDLSGSSPGKPKTATAARERAGCDVSISRSLGAKVSASAAPKDTVIVYVERCNRPVDGAEVFVTFGSPGDPAHPSFPARPTGIAGEYKVQLPVRVPMTDITDAELCQEIASALGHGCTFTDNVPGGQDLLCAELGAAVAAGTLNPPAGGGTFVMCEATFKALTVYCSTLGKGYHGAPSLADAICAQIRQQEAAGNVYDPFPAISQSHAEIQAFARLPGTPMGTSQPLSVPATGPFEELLINLQDTEVLDRFSTTPAAPEPGESYVATAKLSCIPTGSVVRLSVARSASFYYYYYDSTEITVRSNNPDPVIDLLVPGAREDAVDMLTVEIVGGDLKRDIFVTFGSETETDTEDDDDGCPPNEFFDGGVDVGNWTIYGYRNLDDTTGEDPSSAEISLSGQWNQPTISWSLGGAWLVQVRAVPGYDLIYHADCFDEEWEDFCWQEGFPSPLQLGDCSRDDIDCPISWHLLEPCSAYEVVIDSATVGGNAHLFFSPNAR